MMRTGGNASAGSAATTGPDSGAISAKAEAMVEIVFNTVRKNRCVRLLFSDRQTGVP